MFYEERMIGGVMHFRTDPNEQFQQYNIAALSERYEAAKAEIQQLRTESSDYKRAAIEAEERMVDLTEKLLWYAEEKGAVMAPQIRDLVKSASASGRDEPSTEEGGEDVFGLPAKCVKFPCDGQLIATCIDCGTSYGSVDGRQGAERRAVRGTETEKLIDSVKHGTKGSRR